MAKKVLNEVVANYDFKQEVTTPVEELLGIDTQLPTAAIMNLDEMGRFIDSHTLYLFPSLFRFFKFRNKWREIEPDSISLDIRIMTIKG